MPGLGYTVGMVAIGLFVGFLVAVDFVRPTPFNQLVEGGMVTCGP